MDDEALIGISYIVNSNTLKKFTRGDKQYGNIK